jgi:hypothetical protein
MLLFNIPPVTVTLPVAKLGTSTTIFKAFTVTIIGTTINVPLPLFVNVNPTPPNVVETLNVCVVALTT